MLMARWLFYRSSAVPGRRLPQILAKALNAALRVNRDHENKQRAHEFHSSRIFRSALLAAYFFLGFFFSFFGLSPRAMTQVCHHFSFERSFHLINISGLVNTILGRV